MWNSVGMGNNFSLAVLSSYFKAFLSCAKRETIKFPWRKVVILLSFGFRYDCTVVQSENKVVNV